MREAVGADKRGALSVSLSSPLPSSLCLSKVYTGEKSLNVMECNFIADLANADIVFGRVIIYLTNSESLVTVDGWMHHSQVSPCHVFYSAVESGFGNQNGCETKTVKDE